MTTQGQRKEVCRPLFRDQPIHRLLRRNPLEWVPIIPPVEMRHREKRRMPDPRQRRERGLRFRLLFHRQPGCSDAPIRDEAERLDFQVLFPDERLP